MNIAQQEKDRKNWTNSFNYRNELITKAIKIGLTLNRPHEMKISELEALVQFHYKSNQ